MKKRILLVEDTELLLKIEHSLLKRESFELYTARTAREALEKTIHLRPDLVMLSLIMPDMRGDEVCSTLKADPDFRNLKVVICTSDSDEASLSSIVDAGCDGIVTKPLDKDRLFETVHKLLGEALRRKPRFRVQVPCAVYVGGEGLPGAIVDLSEIGCRLEMENPPDSSTVIEVGFDLPDTAQAVRWDGEVRWRILLKSGQGKIGVEFHGMPTDELANLHDILEAMPEKAKL